MYSEHHQFSAVHEAGHVVCVACFPSQLSEQLADLGLIGPSRIEEIYIYYDNENERCDGRATYSIAGLSNEKRLVITLGGKVAELMARTEGHWDVIEIQDRFSSREFDGIRDMETAYTLLREINENNDTKRSLAEFVSRTFSFLEQEWNVVIKISEALLSKYDRKTREAKLLSKDFSSEIQTLFHQLESTPHLFEVGL